jgi:LysR family hydrogen peroxide-inducible transcriptional activator
VGVLPTVAPYLLPEVVPRLAAQQPRLTVVWIEEKTARLLADLRAGDLDAAVVALESELGEGLEQVELFRDPFLLAAPPGHALSRGTARPVRLGQLAGSTVLLLDDGHCLRDQALSFCDRADAREMEFRATSLPTLAQMVAAGAGVTLLPELALDAEARPAGLRIRRFIDPAPNRTIALVWRPRSPLAGALRQLAAAMRAAYPARAASGPRSRPARQRARR